MADDHDVNARGHDDQSSPMLCSRVKKCQSKPPSPKRVKYTLCGHCDTLVSVKTYKKHYRLFYIETSGEWISPDGSLKPSNSEGMGAITVCQSTLCKHNVP